MLEMSTNILVLDERITLVETTVREYTTCTCTCMNTVHVYTSYCWQIKTRLHYKQLPSSLSPYIVNSSFSDCQYGTHVHLHFYYST